MENARFRGCIPEWIGQETFWRPVSSGNAAQPIKEIGDIWLSWEVVASGERIRSY